MDNKLCIEFMAGEYKSTGLYLNEYRLTPKKVWGYMHRECLFQLDYDFLKKSCDADGNIHFEVYREKKELCINGVPTQGNAILEEFQNHVNKIEARRQRFLNRPGDHNWDLCQRWECKISITNIENAMNSRL